MIFLEEKYDFFEGIYSSMRRLSKYIVKNTGSLRIFVYNYTIFSEDPESGAIIHIYRPIGCVAMLMLSVICTCPIWHGRNCEYYFDNDHIEYTIEKDVCDMHNGSGAIASKDFLSKDMHMSHLYSIITNGVCLICAKK